MGDEPWWQGTCVSEWREHWLRRARQLANLCSTCAESSSNHTPGVSFQVTAPFLLVIDRRLLCLGEPISHSRLVEVWVHQGRDGEVAHRGADRLAREIESILQVFRNTSQSRSVVYSALWIRRRRAMSNEGSRILGETSAGMTADLSCPGGPCQ